MRVTQDRVPLRFCLRSALLASLALLAVSAVHAAEVGADFWKAHAAWIKLQTDTDAQIVKQKDAAGVRRVQDAGWARYLAGLGNGKEQDAWRTLVQQILLLHRIQYRDVGYDVVKLETELRALWARQYKPDRTDGLGVLHGRYMLETNYVDALRVAEECYFDYGWTWEARRYLERVIFTLRCMPQQKAMLSARLEEYHDRHLTQLDAGKTLSAGLQALSSMGELDQAARLVESCLSAYTDCDWEPQFLLLAVQIHTARINAALRTQDKPVSPQPPSRSMPETTNAPSFLGAVQKPKPAAPTRLTVMPAPQASTINSAARLAAAVKRCVEVYPYEPACADAIAWYFRWALARERDPAIREQAGHVATNYLAMHQAAPNWAGLYAAGKGLISTNDAAWPALAAAASGYAAMESNRNERLKALVQQTAEECLPHARALCEFVEANPETPQARKAFEGLLALLLTGPQQVEEGRELLQMGRKTLRAAFPASPVYQRQQLAAMSVKGIEPDCTEIAMSLIETARNPVQKEWAYYWNHARFLQRGTYSISAFQLWIEHYPNSYLVPEQLAAVTARAVYDGKPEIASEACGIAYAACGNSLTVARQVGANLGTWLRYACDKAIKDETTAKATVRRKGAKAIERDASAMANAQANCIDEAQTGRTSLGAIYYNALTWSSAIDFRTKRGQSPKQILRSKEYFSGFFYYYGMAYKNDR